MANVYLDKEKLKSLVNKELLRTERSAKEASVLKDYLISFGDTFVESFPNPKAAKDWLDSNCDIRFLKIKGMSPFKLASYILEDSTDLTVNNREKIIKSWTKDLGSTKETAEIFSNLEVIAYNCPSLLPELIGKFIESKMVEIESSLANDKRGYNTPTFNNTDDENNTLENLYCLGVVNCFNPKTILPNWLQLKPYIDKLYVGKEINLGYKAEMYLGAFEVLLIRQPEGGYSAEDQKLISKQFKNTVDEGIFNHLMSLDRDRIFGTISRLSKLESYIDLSPVKSFYNDNLGVLLKKYLGQIENGVPHEKAIDEDKIKSALSWLQGNITSLSLYDGLDKIDLYGIKYTKSLSFRGVESDYPLMLDLLTYGTDNPSIISKVIVGHEKEILNYKDKKDVGFMYKVLNKSKGRAKLILGAIADYPDTFKKIILDDKKLTEKLYGLMDDKITRILDKCKIESELLEVNKDDAKVVKTRTVKI